MGRYNLSDNQIYVLKLLLNARCLTHKQITNCFYGHLGEEYALKQQGNIFNLLKRLIDRDLITKERSGRASKNKQADTYFYLLTETGLEFMENYYQITINKKGSGYDDDFGSMDYRIYKTNLATERSPQSEHTFYEKESFVQLMILNNLNELNTKLANIRSDGKLKFEYHEIMKSPAAKRELTNVSSRLPKDIRATNFISYRNNLYCAPLDGEVAYKPDGEIEVEGLRYFLEIDMGNERGKSLGDKFEIFNERIRELKMKGEVLPAGILFILKVADPKSSLKAPIGSLLKRYRNVHTRFRQFNTEHLSDVGLHVITISDFQEYIVSLTARSLRESQRQFELAFSQYILTINPNEIIEWSTFEQSKRFFVASISGEFYIYAFMEGSNTKVWHNLMLARLTLIDEILHQTGEEHDIKVLVVYKNVIPFYPLGLKELKGEERKFYNSLTLAQLKGSQLYWFSPEYIAIENLIDLK